MNREQFILHVRESEATMYRMAKSILTQESDCEDAAQNAILHAYEKLDSLRDERYFKTWLIRILLNECYKIRNSQKRIVPYEEYCEKQSDVSVPEQGSELYEAVQRLEEKVRTVIVLHYVEGYSVEETADILNIPVGTVKSRLHSGRKRLRILLEEEDKEADRNEVSRNKTIRRAYHERA